MYIDDVITTIFCCVILHNLLIARGDYDSVFSDCDNDSSSESEVESDDSGDGDGDDEMRTGNIRDALATYLASLSLQ